MHDTVIITPAAKLRLYIINLLDLFLAKKIIKLPSKVERPAIDVNKKLYTILLI